VRLTRLVTSGSVAESSAALLAIKHPRRSGSAAVVAVMVSDEASFITGSELFVDGGKARA
jgi:hypothetical protein